MKKEGCIDCQLQKKCNKNQGKYLSVYILKHFSRVFVEASIW